MIKFENIEAFGWEAAIRGMRNPMNSWDKSDSSFIFPRGGVPLPALFKIGPNDLKLMQSLLEVKMGKRANILKVQDWTL